MDASRHASAVILMVSPSWVWTSGILLWVVRACSFMRTPTTNSLANPGTPSFNGSWGQG